MVTITVDEDPAAARAVAAILERLDPLGRHLEAASPAEAMELTRTATPDVAFLETVFHGGDGMELAKSLQLRFPLIHIVFVTDRAEFALDAFQIFAGGYLLKPVTEHSLARVLSHLERDGTLCSRGGLKVQCFGSFEVFFRGEPVRFRRSRTKQLFAYLIDRNGAMCTNHMMASVLWPDREETASRLSQLRTLVADMSATFSRLGVSRVLRRARGAVGIDRSYVECDYYEYLRGSPIAIHQFQGEYMSQYSFGETTLANLQRSQENPYL